MLAGEPAEAAAQREPDEADVGGRAAEGGETVGRAGGHHVARERAGVGAGGPGLGIDLDPGHPVRLHQDGAGEVGERAGGVAGPLRRHAEGVLAGEVDDRLDVGGVGGHRNRVGALVESQVPGLPGHVPAVTAGGGQRPAELLGERFEVGLRSCFHRVLSPVAETRTNNKPATQTLSGPRRPRA